MDLPHPLFSSWYIPLSPYRVARLGAEVQDFKVPSQEIRQPCPYYHDPVLLLLVYFGIEIKQSMATFTPILTHESFVIQKSENLSHHPFNTKWARRVQLSHGIYWVTADWLIQ